MAKLNTNSNVYTIVYASVMVIIVAFLLAFVASSLKATQDKNVALDTKKQILASLNVRECADPEAEWSNILGDQDQNADILTANVNGEEKLVVKVKGAGLWGPIWGWVSINKDGQTVYGTFFNHESETAGLGARIKDDQSFQDAFQNKQIFDADGNVALSVLKKGKEGNLGQEFIVEAVTGATLTSNGVNDMIQAGLKQHADVIKAFAGGDAADAEAIPEVDEYEKIETIDKPVEPKVEEMED